MDDKELAAFLAARCGKLTASRMRHAMSFKKDGSPSAERTQLMKDLLAERLTQCNVRHYVTPAMEFGLEYEDEAKNAYEAFTGELLTRGGVFDHPIIDMLAATPDALLGGNGLVEFKVPTSSTFVTWVLAGVIPPEHVPQMAVQLMCTGREFCNFCAFDPRIVNRERQLFIRQYVPTAKEIAAIESAAVQFLAEVDQLWELFHAAAA